MIKAKDGEVTFRGERDSFRERVQNGDSTCR